MLNLEKKPNPRKETGMTANDKNLDTAEKVLAHAFPKLFRKLDIGIPISTKQPASKATHNHQKP